MAPQSDAEQPYAIFVRVEDLCDGRVIATTYPFPEGTKYVRELPVSESTARQVPPHRSGGSVVPGEVTKEMLREMFEQECKDGDRLAEALGVPRTDGGWLNVPKMLAKIKALRSNGGTVPEGWKLLPKILTEEMIVALEEGDLPLNSTMREYWQAAWDSALAASPSSQESKDEAHPLTSVAATAEHSVSANNTPTEKERPEFAAVLRQIKERGEDPYCGFEEVLCEIVRQLQRELATEKDMRERERKEWYYAEGLLKAAQSARAAIIEECAKEAEHWCDGEEAAEAIRALARTSGREEQGG